MPFSSTVLNGAPLSRENFTTPPKELGILPFWFWNGEMDEREMEWQLREYKSKGIPGIFIHGRFGLKVPYISDKWFQKVKYAVQKAKEIGLDAWVYDEMNWPSGTAERKVPAQFPHLTQRYLELVALNVDGPLFTFLEATDDRYVNTGNSYPIAAFGCTEEEFQKGITHPIDLTQNLSFERVIPWEAPAGKWRLLYFLEKEVPYYIDALNPESTKRFLELTHERYKSSVGGEFGKTVPGFYTDEPAMHYYHVGIDNYVVPWTTQMFKIFRQRRGYDLRPWLPALYLNMGKATARIRYDFWRTLTEQYSEAYYGQIRQWCDANGVLFTGHLLFEEWIRMHARCEGNLFKHLKHMHIVGVDHLYPKIGTEQEPDQHVALKIASSAAHFYRSARLLCESMGGAYWDCTLERMKWMLNWEYVLGVNLFNNHGYHYSIEGERKRDWPPSQFYHHTWWKHYDRFTAYANRLSHLLSGGRHVAKVLMLYPLTSIWTNYTPQARTAVGNVTEGDFNYLTDALLRLHYDFDIVDEDILAGAALRDGTISIADEAYSLLIIPPMTHMKRATFEAVKKFVKNGGAVIADTLLPVEFLDTDRPDASTDVKAVFGVDPGKLLAAFEQGKKSPVRAVPSRRGNRAVVLTGRGLHAAKPKKLIDRVLRSVVTPDVTVDREEVFYLHRVKDGFDIYLFVNTSQQDIGTVGITFEQAGCPELWDATTGKTTPLHVHRLTKNRVSIHLDFPASESRVVVMSPPSQAPYVTETNLDVLHIDETTVSGSSAAAGTVFARVMRGRKATLFRARAKKPLAPISLGRTFAFATEQENVLAIGQWRMLMADGVNNVARYADPAVDDADWLPVTNGAWEMQLGQERDASTYPVTLWYRTGFEVAQVPSALRLIIDGFSGSSYRLFINGTEIRDRGVRSSLDAEMKEVDIHPHVRLGRNVVAVRLVVQRRTDGMLDLLKLVGTFGLVANKEGHVIAPPLATIVAGDWTKQGYPYYSGTGVYRTEVTIPERYIGGRLFLEADCGEDVLEVSINGGTTAVAPWHPYKIEITDSVHAGPNTFELKVTNTLINVLEAVQKPSGLMKAPRIVHEHRYTFPAR